MPTNSFYLISRTLASQKVTTLWTLRLLIQWVQWTADALLAITWRYFRITWSSVFYVCQRPSWSQVKPIRHRPHGGGGHWRKPTTNRNRRVDRLDWPYFHSPYADDMCPLTVLALNRRAQVVIIYYSRMMSATCLASTTELRWKDLFFLCDDEWE